MVAAKNLTALAEKVRGGLVSAVGGKFCKKAYY
jgi:hypothetical protein